MVSLNLNAVDADSGYVIISLDGVQLEKVEIEEYKFRMKALNYFSLLMDAEKNGRVYLSNEDGNFHIRWADKNGNMLKRIDFKVKEDVEKTKKIITNNI